MGGLVSGPRKPRDAEDGENATPVLRLRVAGIDSQGPPHLDEDALVLWRTTVLDLNGLGILDRADAATLEGFVVCVTRARAAGRDVRARGICFDETVTARNGDVRTKTTINPAVRLERDSWSQARYYATELGLTPASRARLRAAGLVPESLADDLPGLGDLIAMRPTAGSVSSEP